MIKCYDKIDNSNKKQISNLFNWLENHDMLSEDGLIEKESLGSDTMLTKELFTESGNKILNRYYNRFKHSFFNEDVNEFWNNRLRDMELINKVKLSEESSFDLSKTNSKNKFDSIKSYLESLDVNIPNGTDTLVMDVYLENGNFSFACQAYDKKGHNILEDANFTVIANNRELVPFNTDVHDDVKDAVVSIGKKVKTEWKNTPRFFKGDMLFRNKDTNFKAKFLNDLTNNGKKSLTEEVLLTPDKMPKHIYHVSNTNCDGEIFKPKKFNAWGAKHKLEKPVKRICFSDSINGCLMAKGGTYYNYDIYVMIPDPKKKYKVYKPTGADVYDAPVTHELWITEPVKMVTIGMVHIDDIDKHHLKANHTSIGASKIFGFHWHWVEKYYDDKSLYEKDHTTLKYKLLTRNEDSNVIDDGKKK
jgi:hypothetical protein